MIEVEKITEGSIYHYTDDNAIRSILTSGKFWASKSNFLNDTSEFIYIDEIIKESCVDFMGNEDMGNLLYQEIKKEKDRLTDDRVENPIVSGNYVLSFSLNPDSITLWSEYCNFFGYNMGFNVKELRKILDNRESVNPLSLDGKVIYEKERQKHIINNELEQAHELFNSEGLKEIIKRNDEESRKVLKEIV